MPSLLKPLLAVLMGVAPAAAAPPLRCTPDVVHSNTVALVLELPDPHGRELAVIGPDRTFYYLAFQPGGALPDRVAIPDFQTARTITLDPRVLEGWRFEANGRWDRVFQLPGVYEFRAADVLQTDFDPGDDPVATCRVHFEVSK